MLDYLLRRSLEFARDFYVSCLKDSKSDMQIRKTNAYYERMSRRNLNLTDRATFSLIEIIDRIQG